MAEYFKFKILYTPIIPYLVDFESNRVGAYLEFMKEINLDFSQNHIYYLKEKLVNNKLIFDPIGANISVKYASRNRWVGLHCPVLDVIPQKTTYKKKFSHKM